MANPSYPNEVTVIVSPTPVNVVDVLFTRPTQVVTGGPTTVNTVSTSTETVSVEELGIVGPPGPQGASGQDGSAPQAYQLFAVSQWTQLHTYGYPPEVRLVDEDNEAVEVGVDYPDAHTVSITFPVPFTGTVYLS